MARQTNTDKNGNQWTESTKTAVWEKGVFIEGYDAGKWRRDKCGHAIEWNQFGNRQSEYGWEIDHIYPVAKGGDDAFGNLQPLYWKHNAEKSDSLDWKCP